MGQKINPIGFRVGVIRDWEAKWYADKQNYTQQLHEDLRLRRYIDKNLADASVDRVVIERKTASRIDVNIFTARPGVVIGKGGSEIEKLRKALSNLTDKIGSNKSKQVFVNVVEVKKPDLNAHLVGMQIASDLERRVAFRRAMRGAIQRAMRAGAKGIKVMVSGRLNGADIARVEQYTEGTVPLHTLRADIDYSWDEAMTSYGNLGIKTWIYRGDVLPGEIREDDRPASTQNNDSRSGNNRGGRRPSNGPRRDRTSRPASRNNEAQSTEATASPVENVQEGDN